jgi:hypothetical protein
MEALGDALDVRTSEWSNVAGLMHAENGSHRAQTEYNSDPRVTFVPHPTDVFPTVLPSAT